MSDRLLVGTRKGLFVLKRGGGDWDIVSTHFLGDPVSVVLVDPRDGALYAALDLGHFGAKLRRSEDGGASWEELTAPAYPKRPDDAPPDTDGSGRELPWSVKKIWALAAGGDDQPGRLWCGSIPGGLFLSDDRGQTWSLNRPLWDHDGRKQWFGGGADWPGIHSILVDPRNSRRVIVGVSCGGVWVTEDDGESWNVRAEGMRAEYVPPGEAQNPNTQDPHLVVLCPDAPDRLWVQHHNGIFKSDDGCASWQELTDVKPSVFGFAVAVHPRDADTAWFVPAVKDESRIPVDGKLVVNRTKDGGKTFESITEGLPQRHAYDLVYRHALDVDARGERLAFGSTTGSLWLSENGGDAWRHLSAHLPPVYCVRFA